MNNGIFKDATKKAFETTELLIHVDLAVDLDKLAATVALNPRNTELQQFLGGLSLHLNHLIAQRVSAPYRQFGTLPIGIFLSNLDSGQLETSLMTSYCHF